MGDSMSTIINATTTNGVVIQPDNSGSLVLQTNSGTTALTINTAQNTTLAGKLTTASSGIQFSDASTQTAAASPYVLKNRIINGDMRIDQRYAGASVATPTSYIVDRFQVAQTTSGKITAQQNAGSVTPPVGFTNYLGVNVVSAYSVTSSDIYYIAQLIEGYNTADLAFGTANAQTVTLSFWVRSSLTGTFGVRLVNSANNRSYVATYTINAANTWEKETITITGDTSGTWVGATNGIGIQVLWTLAAGSSFQTTANSWQSGNYTTTSSQTQLVGTNGATFYITGVQLEIGTSATPFERRLYNAELANCQRYYYRIVSGIAGQIFGTAYNNTTSSALVSTPFPVTLRAAPSAIEQSGTAGDYRVNNLATATSCTSVPSFNSASPYFAFTNFTTGATLVAGQSSAGSCNNSNAFLAWSVEL
jgi:hypothetical protein